MEGFFKRGQGKYEIERFVFLLKGIFIVRFNCVESRFKVFDEGISMFDKKFFIVKLWSSEIDVRNFDVITVFIRVRLIDSDLKYWGQNIFIKIVFILGKFIKTDRVIIMKDLLYYIRVFIEVFIDNELLEIMSVENEWGGI